MKLKKLFKMILFFALVIGSTVNQASAQTYGFASVSIGGTSVTVSSASDFLDYISRSGQYTIYLNGTITLSGMNDVASDKAIIGVGTNGKIVGGGLDIDAVDNVVIQNIAFSDWDDDAINMQDGATNVWVDHCSFTNGYDGCVDIKRGSDYITVSWNHFYNHGKTCLLGHSNDNESQDAGHLRVTYHHNYFDGTDSRHPRVRFSALTHCYNNYYLDNEYGVASTCDAEVLVEGNYFENVDDPTLVGYASSGDGDLVETNNIYVDSGDPETSGSVPTPSYSYSLDDPSDVPSIVSSGAGANGTTSDSDDDTDDDDDVNNGYISGTYAIIASHSGKALDVYDWGTSNGTNIGQWTYWGGECQQFYIEPVDGIWHRITPVIATTKSFDVYNISSENCADITIWEYWEGYNQQFRFQSAGTGVWRIINRNSDKCIDIEGASTEDGANAIQYTCTSGSANQMFELIDMGE